MLTDFLSNLRIYTSAGKEGRSTSLRLFQHDGKIEGKTMTDTSILFLELNCTDSQKSLTIVKKSRQVTE